MFNCRSMGLPSTMAVRKLAAESRARLSGTNSNIWPVLRCSKPAAGECASSLSSTAIWNAARMNSRWWLWLDAPNR